MTDTNDALNAALRTGDRDAVAAATTAHNEAIRRATIADALRGPTRSMHCDRERVPINVHPKVVKALRDLLAEDDMRGVGYSEFIARAVAAARGERLG